MLVASLDRVGVDLLAERDAPLEAAVVDLDVLVAAALRRRPPALAGDGEDAVREGEVDLRRIDPRELDDDVERGRVLRPVRVHARPEDGALRRQPVVAEVCEQLLHLALDAVDVTALGHATIVAVARILKLAGAAVGVLLYVWVAAVRLAPTVRARKAARRAGRR